MDLYTKNGIALQVVNELIYTVSGKIVGKIFNDKVYAPNGKYAGTIVRGRLVYQLIHSEISRTSFLAANRPGVIKGNRPAIGMLGSEPVLPEDNSEMENNDNDDTSGIFLTNKNERPFGSFKVNDLLGVKDSDDDLTEVGKKLKPLIDTVEKVEKVGWKILKFIENLT